MMVKPLKIKHHSCCVKIGLTGPMAGFPNHQYNRELAEPSLTRHSLTGRINNKLMHEAFRAVKRNKGAAGVDRVSIEMFARHLEQNLDALMRSLKRGTYRPRPVRRTYIDKGGGKLRPLGIPTVRDRVAQEVLRRLLSPLFEPLFHDDSFGFRPGRSCHAALERVLEIWRTGRRHVLDARKIEQLNAVIRGVARYFATSFATCKLQFRELDGWLRMRLRCMRLKRISRKNNSRIKIKHLRRLGCLFLSDYLISTRGCVRGCSSKEAIP